MRGPPAGHAYGPAPGRGRRGVRCRCAGKRGSAFSRVREGESSGRRSPAWWHCRAWGHRPVALPPRSPAATPASVAAPGGKTALRASAGCKPSGHPLPLQGGCLAQCEPLLPCSCLNLSPLSPCCQPSSNLGRARPFLHLWWHTSCQPNALRQCTPGTHPPPSHLSRGPFWPFLPLPSKRSAPAGDFSRG